MAHLQPAADINLLFGILALQLDFITRDQLIAAMNAWVLDKSRSLSAILVEREALSQERHVLLQALVQEHLKQHHDDPQQSLAALSPVGLLHKDLAKISDSVVQASLVHVPATAERSEDAAPRAGAEDPYATVTQAVGTPTSTGQRFRILRLHARGGLGEVYVAMDEELHREVALKEIQDRHADNVESRARFLLEAEITGGLEHPGIVPVYGLGHYADGRPFYAMRFIKGDSLKDAIERFHKADTPDRAPGERALALRNILGRFIDVCQAIQYAHDRGVLHRDLKPGNIMLGKYGETLVVDWGLAKSLGKAEAVTPSAEPLLRPSSASGSAETLPGSALGTPQYMSPEQAAGHLDQLGPASDVYSLGATMYCLLTGQAPFGDSDVGTTLQRVQRGDFPRPRHVNGLVPPALEAVCLKAMALQAQDRYATPRLLAGEIEHWLGDEPVSVWPEPWTQRTVRWARRHRSWAEAVAAVFVAAIVITTVAALWQRQQAAQERQARLAAEELQEKGLRVAAQFAARTLAYEIDLRWWILRGAADDAELRHLLGDLAKVEQPRDHAACKQLHAWLKDRCNESSRTKAASWFVADQRGRHMARHPPDERLVGRNFAFRDYFHGKGQDFPEGTQKEPITDVHRSLVFESQATQNRMVAFSVPIWSGQPRQSECLGVLAMTVELGHFAGLRIDRQQQPSGERKDRVAVLVDAREDSIEGQGHRGLVLHHPYFAEARKNGAGKRTMLRLDSRQVERLERLRQRGFLELSGEDLDRNYQDPAGGLYAGRWLAAFAPVVIEDRPAQTKDTGWVVIMQER